jgi:hypothetical protein
MTESEKYIRNLYLWLFLESENEKIKTVKWEIYLMFKDRENCVEDFLHCFTKADMKLCRLMRSIFHFGKDKYNDGDYQHNWMRMFSSISQFLLSSWIVHSIYTPFFWVLSALFFLSVSFILDYKFSIRDLFSFLSWLFFSDLSML